MIDKSFKKLIENSSNIVVFTGAGISTESGIPDFRVQLVFGKNINQLNLKIFYLQKLSE